MFYIWLFSSSFFILSIIAQISLFSIGIIPNLMNIFMTLALEITTASLMFKKLKEPHKHSYSLKAVGLWFLYYGFFLLVSGNRTEITANIALRIEFALVLMSIGFLIFYYNQIGTEISKNKTKSNSDDLFKDSKNEDHYFDLICQLHYLMSLNEVKQNPEFYSNIQEIFEIMKTIEQNRGLISFRKLDNINDVYEEYAKLIQEPDMTLDKLKRLAEIEEYTKEIKATLKIYYRKAISSDIDTLDGQIKTIDRQLHQNGLVESDFIISNEKKQTE